jgi:uncharacterized membrane protein YeaQ/YmgE (transglycosylase-associated protein family)
MLTSRGAPTRRQPGSKEVPVGLFHIISMIIVGFIVGVIARFLYPGAVNLGFWATSVIGIVGSLVGGVIGGLVFRSPEGRFHPAGWFLSIVGALLVLWVYLNYLM